MAHFRYQALNAEGQLVEGELRADTVQQAISQLETGGWTVQSIGYAATESRSSSAGASAAQETAHQTLPQDAKPWDASAEQAVLRSHLARVLEQGKAIVPALRAYAEELPAGRPRRQLTAVCQVLERGNLAEAETALGTLPDYWIPLLSAAASSRDAGRVLHEFLEESQRTEELRRQRWLTFAYPLFVAGIAAAVMTVLSFLVVPTFRDIFEEFSLELPPLTLLLLTLSDWITSGRMALVALLLGAIGIFLWNYKWWLPGKASAWLEPWIASPFGHRAAASRFARFTADLLEAGLETPKALRIAGFSTRNSRLRRAAWNLASEMESVGGRGQHVPSRPLTATVLHALRSDMATASRIHLLREVSQCHAERTRRRFSWTHGIIEPVTICVVGILVGGTVIGLFVPLVKLIEGLSM
jgi:type II secretory pathway component PulF